LPEPVFAEDLGNRAQVEAPQLPFKNTALPGAAD
jgi:hypothetical protein